MSEARPAGELERLARRVAQLERLVARAAGGRAPAGEAGESRPVSWLALPAGEEAARALLADLGDWVERVWAEWPDADLPSCWAFHPWVVEELLVARQAWAAAFEGRAASPTRAADWVTRVRPAVAERIGKHIGTCALIHHMDPPRPPEAPLKRHLDQVASHWATHGTPLTPSSTQLAEANHYDRQPYRRI